MYTNSKTDTNRNFICIRCIQAMYTKKMDFVYMKSALRHATRPNVYNVYKLYYNLLKKAIRENILSYRK